MTTLYIVYSEKYGEAEGIFTPSGELLDFWSCNDATWRSEYFNGFMEKLGYTTTVPDRATYLKLEKKLITKIKKEWGV